MTPLELRSFFIEQSVQPYLLSGAQTGSAVGMKSN